MCEIEDEHIGCQRATRESNDHQGGTHLDHTAETKLLDERADEGTCNCMGKCVYDMYSLILNCVQSVTLTQNIKII